MRSAAHGTSALSYKGFGAQLRGFALEDGTLPRLFDKESGMNCWKTLGFAILGLTLAGALAACEKEGPLEKAGKAADNAAEKIGDAVKPEGKAEKAGEAVDHALEKAGDAIKSGVEKAGEKAEEVRDKVKQSASSDSKN
jgi:F0F1-type ATP synthase membrane subunit b/b'